MKLIRSLRLFLSFFFMGTCSIFAQGEKTMSALPKAAVLNVDASGLAEDQKMLGNLLRLELQKHRVGTESAK